ncbi:MAG TPA: serine hydrolase domain-containing protein, partial [Candidatus Tumulicola sp.]
IAIVAGCDNSVAPQPGPSSSFSPATVARINGAIKTWFPEYNAPGVIVGIYIPGRGTYDSAQGTANPATGEPMRIDDRMRIGSVTKTFTVTVLLQLVRKKLVALDDPVSKYVSNVPGGDSITLRMLANMTAGLFNYAADEKFARTLFDHPERSYAPEQTLKVAFAHPPDFAPGTGWNYSNTNTVLLGVILEKVTGKSMGELFRNYTFEPLGLTNTVWPSSSAEIPEPYAHGTFLNPFDEKKADATHWNPSWAFTAGEMISTLHDLKIWAKACATGAQLSPALQQQRLAWVTLPPLKPGNTYGLGIIDKSGWTGHEGSLPGYTSMSCYLPSEDATMIVLVNTDIHVDGKSPALALFRALAQIVTPNNVPLWRDGV